MSISGRHHRRLSSLDSTTRRLRLSDDASSSPSSADLERGLPKRAATERSSSRLASSSQACSTQPSASSHYCASSCSAPVRVRMAAAPYKGEVAAR